MKIFKTLESLVFTLLLPIVFGFNAVMLVATFGIENNQYAMALIAVALIALIVLTRVSRATDSCDDAIDIILGLSLGAVVGKITTEVLNVSQITKWLLLADACLLAIITIWVVFRKKNPTQLEEEEQ